MLLISLFFLVLVIILAASKGFNPLLWILPSGILGFIILLFLPSANANNIDEETSSIRRKSGNRTGGVLSVLILAFIICLFVI